MASVLDSLASAGLPYFFGSFSALDAYHGVEASPLGFVLVQGSLVDLAKACDGLGYPGLPYADASLGSLRAGAEDGGLCYLRLADDYLRAEPAAFAPLDLLRDPRVRATYHAPGDGYPGLRQRRLEARRAAPEDLLFQAAALISRYDYEVDPEFRVSPPRDLSLGAQRDLLVLILTGRHPERGLEFLRATGFLDAYWPEIAALEGVDQAKEFHPEGDAWAHTLETFRYRKLPELRLSLGLLLHDSGKPRASAAEGRRFDRHAEIGSRLAETFLGRLGFHPGLIGEVSYLVRYHMLPAALPRLPLERGIEGVDHPLFPLLLELYKCDELSTFKGPEEYYEACGAYRAYLRQSRNPYRSPEAQRLARLYLGSGSPPPARRRPR